MDKRILNETGIVSALSAGTYLFAYFFQKAYLDYFSVPAVFVEVSIVSICVSAAGLLSLAVLAWYLVGFLPHRIMRSTAIIILALRFYILYLLIFSLSFYYNGYSWFTVLWFFMFLVSLIILLISIVWSVRMDESFWAFIKNELAVNNKILDQTISGKLLASTPGPLIIVMTGLLLLFTCAQISGNWAARMQNNFMEITKEGHNFIVVGNYQNSLILVKVVEDENSKHLRATGDIKLIAINNIGDGINVHSEVYQKADNDRRKSRITFATFKRWLGNLF